MWYIFRFNFSKAFDTVNHDILNHKLEHYGFRGLVKQWFISYLSERRQIVTVNSVKSAECNHVEFLKGQYLAHCYFCYT